VEDTAVIVAQGQYRVCILARVPHRLWSRWKRFAHRAAEIQSHVVLALLYWIVVVPIGAVMRLRAGRGHAAPAWIVRDEGATAGLDEARRQF
jgi:hypothetical protein